MMQLQEGDMDRLASAAFEWDRRNGHHKGGPWTWHMIPQEGQENYRGLVRAVLGELVEIEAERCDCGSSDHTPGRCPHRRFA